MPTHLPLRDSGTMTTSITPCPGHRCFDEYTPRQLGLSRPTPLASAILKRLARTCDDGQHQKSGAYHFDSSSSTPESPEPTLASQHSQTILKTTQARRDSGEKLTTMHWTTHCLTLEAIWRFPAPKGQPRHYCYTLVAVKYKNKIESNGRH